MIGTEKRRYTVDPSAKDSFFNKSESVQDKPPNRATLAIQPN